MNVCRRTMSAAAFLTAMLAAGTVTGAPESRQPPAQRNTVAVIRFVNITRVPADDWIGSGIAETLVSDLRTVEGIAIIGRESILDALRESGSSDRTEPDDRVALQISRRLGATWLIAGSYQHADGMIRITARVVDVGTRFVVRTVKIDGRIGDMFGLQDRVAGELSAGLSATLASSGTTGSDEREPVAAPPQSGSSAQAAPTVRAVGGGNVAGGSDNGPLATPAKTAPQASAPEPSSLFFPESRLDKGRSDLALLAGAANTVAGFHLKGNHNFRTAMVEWGRILTRRRGTPPLAGYLEGLVEVLPLFVESQSPRAYGFGVMPVFFRWIFAQPAQARPFLEIAGGLLATNRDVPEQVARFNFLAYAGLGVRARLSDRHALLLGYRFHHISNGNRVKPNPGINSNMLLMGISTLR